MDKNFEVQKRFIKFPFSAIIIFNNISIITNSSSSK